MGAREKEQFCDMMRRVSVFSGVEVLTYTVLDNHFHLLIEVPRRVDISDEELIARLRLIYRSCVVDAINRELMACRDEEDACGAERLRKQYLYRMYDLSEFMKTLKQRFAIWYNVTHNRKGHLWDDRFKSVLVEGGRGRSSALWVVAQYIELNAVRAGIVTDASAYRWCGFAAAIAGVDGARMGISRVVGGQNGVWLAVCRVYGRGLIQKVAQGDFLEGGGDAGGVLSRCRVRYFVDGVVLGSAAFVEHMFAVRRHLFCSSRKTAARKMRGGVWSGLCTVRDFRKRVIELS